MRNWNFIVESIPQWGKKIVKMHVFGMYKILRIPSCQPNTKSWDGKSASAHNLNLVTKDNSIPGIHIICKLSGP